MGYFKQAPFVLGGAREGSFDVPEKLAFQERFRKSAAIDGDKWLGRTRGAGVDGARHQLFACPALPVDEHGAGGRSHGANRRFQFFDGRALADDVGERVTTGGVALISEVLPLQRHGLKSAANGDLEFLHQARALVDIVKRPDADRLHRGFIVLHRRNEDHRGFRRGMPGKAQHLNAVSLRHLDVRDQHLVVGRA